MVLSGSLGFPKVNHDCRVVCSEVCCTLTPRPAMSNHWSCTGSRCHIPLETSACTAGDTHTHTLSYTYTLAHKLTRTQLETWHVFVCVCVCLCVRLCVFVGAQLCWAVLHLINTHPILTAFVIFKDVWNTQNVQNTHVHKNTHMEHKNN